jgi:hypothetical protein
MQRLRRMLEVSLAALLLLTVSLEAQSREIRAEEAASHIGETVTVRGTVANVHTPQGLATPLSTLDGPTQVRLSLLWPFAIGRLTSRTSALWKGRRCG